MARPATPMFPEPTAEEICSEGALSPDGAAEFTSLSRPEIDRAIARGEIEIFRYGRRVLIAKREAVRWLATYLEASRQNAGRI
ncbi:hypothetical protein VT84_05235 [Gemmata sp. SH-PL17]|uniref:hypothetical protein n=1 Tax=Gemmata sp. SH-PL17 TaxID=1630693 RepID=UPI00078CFC4E|nr:hypothetical protein [Gemmata sp. SH-PL17]AMV23794.1 hypothetical protein VT84_05235 [Gemmata sp. SH-PL17]